MSGRLGIRPARPSERETLEELQRRASLANERHRSDLLAHPEAIELPPSQIVNGDVVVAELDDEVAGFAVLLIGEEGAELDGLFVEPALWKHGIGRALVEHGAQRAAQAGSPAVEVTANPEARAFYEAVGFEKYGEAATRFGPAIRMRRLL